MALLEAVLVLAVGYLSGRVTRFVAKPAAIVALVLAIVGLAAPDAFFRLAKPVLSVYRGNELLFLSGFLFGIAHEESRE